MKKLILTLSLIATSLVSSEIEIAAKIIDKISKSLVQKQEVVVYTDDIRSLYMTKLSKDLSRTKVCSKADIILTKNKTIPECEKGVLIFATTYLAYKALPQAVGAFFYQKGRPSIIFRKENLEKHNIVLSEEFSKYIQ